MPELPEVETVRDGLARHVLGSTVRTVTVHRDSAVRRHDGGPRDFSDRLRGRVITAAVRRGKFLWLLLDDDSALMAHLGMSGQLLVAQGESVAGPPTAPAPHRHTRATLALEGPGGPLTLSFVDQRTFGHLAVTELVPTADGAPGGRGSPLAAVPVPVGHIARDLLDPALDRELLVGRVRRTGREVKRVLLDQTVVSGIGNIYADEALWRAGLHFTRPCDRLSRPRAHSLLRAAHEVMSEALLAGGTSFDALYVNVNGASGYFDRSLAVYGQAGRPCPRCGATVVRDPFMNRSSFTCPRCQRRPSAERLSRRARTTA
ncbi:bifunctional DNA-formamidopyrimidine glycosylase/DNA-(apurinic or apyrimidinic site) lyase [Cellulomonas bogoriensis]|uniref:Formamidopyrimidine-DNA glycosylase n=1 Tax=Cellulomonas bogoriensis 69B4 = DSM 16987 TaxID=1386082 RepID=A0A0A0BYQ4_9CELL|nr:bifunctional DNA-formamidopyrimidine glycosylase/DNA-(apurinic or apyrimidinic site) lyase [Cellulomonas bogoriensis]KGM13095.1 5-hydroxymethyluracil DNA glycosylase [Cellulomonas bogoriensis 69B4 = DSM 16987]